MSPAPLFFRDETAQRAAAGEPLPEETDTSGEVETDDRGEQSSAAGNAGG